MWAVLTRLEEPKKAGLTVMQKMKLYNGKSIPGFTEDSVKELKEEAPREGMDGISPRYVQDKVSNALVSRQAIEEQDDQPVHGAERARERHSATTRFMNDEDLKKRYREILSDREGRVRGHHQGRGPACHQRR